MKAHSQELLYLGDFVEKLLTWPTGMQFMDKEKAE